MKPPAAPRSAVIRYLLFIAALVGAAALLLTQPPERSPFLFALLIVAALAAAGIDRAVRAGMGPRAVARFLLRRVRQGIAWFLAARRSARCAPPLARTLDRRLPPLQFAAEALLVIFLAAAIPQPFLTPDSDTQLFGREAEWLTSSAHLAANTLRERGYIPLWQPYLEFGEPLIDGPFAFVLNPITAGPSLVYGGVRGIKLGVVLTAVTAGLGGWVLGRVLGLSAVGRLLLAFLMVGKGNMHAMIGAGYYQRAPARPTCPGSSPGRWPRCGCRIAAGRPS